MEKYVVRKANKFISHGGRLIVPALVSEIDYETNFGVFYSYV